MAFVVRPFAFVTFGDSRKKDSTVSVQITAAAAQAYATAVDGAARAATDAGLLIAAIAGLSAGTVVKRGIEYFEVDDAPVYPLPEDAVFNFDKHTVGYKDGLRRYVFSIPARDDAALNVGSDGVTGIIAGAGASQATIDLVDAVEDTMIGAGQGAPTVEYINVTR